MNTTCCRVEWVVDAGLTVPRFGRARARALLERALIDAGHQGRHLLTVRLVDDVTACELHRDHFNDPTTTDVMTFPDGDQDPASRCLRLGDLAVCVDVARREASARGRTVADELTLYILHGMLHLLGYDDMDDDSRQIMWDEQRRLLATIGIPLEERPT
jgi:rRNA maturation RNase YbeY